MIFLIVCGVCVCVCVFNSTESAVFGAAGIAECSGKERFPEDSLAVYGACHCTSSGGEPCPCAKSAASSRMQVLQLKQEVLYRFSTGIIHIYHTDIQRWKSTKKL
uniref:Secreted protein n=1 Tax=Astyanax mexicanus TaxID=7994 RepID=A0A8B9KBE4_ASTMX